MKTFFKISKNRCLFMCPSLTKKQERRIVRLHANKIKETDPDYSALLLRKARNG